MDATQLNAPESRLSESRYLAMGPLSPRQPPPVDEAWLRRFEQLRLGGDAVEMSELSLLAAQRSLHEVDVDQCLSHLHRVDRLLAAAPVTQRVLSLLGDLAELTLHAASLVRGVEEQDDPMRHRQLAELTRDRCYAVTGRLDRMHDQGTVLAITLRVASLLEAAGDAADAHAMRARAGVISS